MMLRQNVAAPFPPFLTQQPPTPRRRRRRSPDRGSRFGNNKVFSNRQQQQRQQQQKLQSRSSLNWRTLLRRSKIFCSKTNRLELLPEYWHLSFLVRSLWILYTRAIDLFGKVWWCIISHSCSLLLHEELPKSTRKDTFPEVMQHTRVALNTVCKISGWKESFIEYNTLEVVEVGKLSGFGNASIVVSGSVSLVLGFEIMLQAAPNGRTSPCSISRSCEGLDNERPSKRNGKPKHCRFPDWWHPEKKRNI